MKKINRYCVMVAGIVGLMSVSQNDLQAASTNEKKMVIVIPSYNNSRWYKQNIDSVIHQNYSNYHIVYIDDCSTDNTYQLVKEYVAQQHCEHKVTLIGNAKRRGALANLYIAIHACPNDYIIVTIDGDDWLTNNDVLSRVNKAYADSDVWMTYGQFYFYPENRMGECKAIPKKVIKKNTYREYDWCTSHLRTFYAGLFKKIKLEDLVHKGAFFDVTWDRAFMYPMLEMAAGRFAFIPEVLYGYNCDNPSNDFKVKLLEQFKCCNLIRSMKKYEALGRAPYKN